MSKSLENLDEIYALRCNSEEQETKLNKSYTIIDVDYDETYEEGEFDCGMEESSYSQITRVGEGLQQRLGSLREEEQSRERPLLVIEQEEEQLEEEREAKNRESPIYNEVSEVPAKDSGFTDDGEVIIKKKTEKEDDTQLSVDDLKENKLSDSYWILPKVEVVQFGEPVWDQSDLDNELD